MITTTNLLYHNAGIGWPTSIPLLHFHSRINGSILRWIIQQALTQKRPRGRPWKKREKARDEREEKAKGKLDMRVVHRGRCGGTEHYRSKFKNPIQSTNTTSEQSPTSTEQDVAGSTSSHATTKHLIYSLLLLLNFYAITITFYLQGFQKCVKRKGRESTRSYKSFNTSSYFNSSSKDGCDSNSTKSKQGEVNNKGLLHVHIQAWERT